MEGGGLRAPTLGESVTIKTYTAAVENSLKSTDEAGDKLATAAVSIATAYGAVIALVAPKESTAALLVASPFAAFAIALVLGLWAQSLGVAAKPEEDLDKVQKAVDTLVDTKRLLNRIALAVLGVGLIGAGIVVADKYKSPPKPSTAAVVWLSSSGQADVVASCGQQVKMISGHVDPTSLAASWITIEKPRIRCPGTSDTLTLPASAVASVSIHS
jgi:hypothetical protein